MSGTWDRKEMHIKFWWANLKGGDHLEGLGVDGRIMLEWIVMK
jgi:hypothetical protein